MSKTAWTKGPWTRCTGGTVNPKIYGIDGRDGRAVIRWQGIAKPESLESQANAHLIAAAPELYEALNRAMVELDAAADGLGAMGKIDHADDCRLTVKAVLEVMAKARGEL